MKPVFKPAKWAASSSEEVLEFRSVKNKPALKKTSKKEKNKQKKLKKTVDKVVAPVPQAQNLKEALESMESKFLNLKCKQ